MLLGCTILEWTGPSLDSPGTRERSSHQYSMKLYVCMLHLFLFASLCECCAFVLPSSASFLSPSSFALADLWWSAHVVPPGVSLLLFASVPSVHDMYTTETAFGTLATCCGLYFFQFDKSLSADMHWVFGPFSALVGHGPPFPHPPSTVTQVLLSTVNFVMGDCEELKIVTFNTNGLGEFKKRKDVFDFLRKQSEKYFLATRNTLENWGRECDQITVGF